MTDPRLHIERAIEATRKNATQQMLIGVVFGAAWILSRATTLGIVLACVHALIMFFLVRRWLRLRPKAPVIQALLVEPQKIAEITGWPPKLPNDRLPVFIEVRTHDKHKCSLLQDPKQRQQTIDLVGALYARSPDAMFTVPNIPLAATKPDTTAATP